MVYSKTALSKNANVADANNGEVICGLCHDSVEDPVVSLLFLLWNIILLCAYGFIFPNHLYEENIESLPAL